LFIVVLEKLQLRSTQIASCIRLKTPALQGGADSVELNSIFKVRPFEVPPACMLAPHPCPCYVLHSPAPWADQKHALAEAN